MFSAISGLRANSDWLDVIGNNVANTSTTAFKSSSVRFATQFSQFLSNGTADNSVSSFGGQDPVAIGRGTRLQNIRVNFAEGATQMTGVSTDISIQGDGFLVAKNGSNTYLTRAGNLNFDSKGFLVDGSGGLVQGFTAVTQYDKLVINSVANGPNLQPLEVTRAHLVLNSTNMGAIGNIQIDPQMTIPPKATTEIKFTGNLDSYQQATQPGGILDLFPGGQPILPVTVAMLLNGIPNSIDPARMTVAPIPPGGFGLQQVTDLGLKVAGVDIPLENGFTNLIAINIFSGSYAWELKPPMPPAVQMNQTVFDSLGNQRQVTVQFYQINDLGPGGLNSAAGPSQTCYAWYAFDTTGGQPVSTQNLVGGTGIYEGDFFPNWYDRGSTVNPAQPVGYGGDYLYFNTDGSLASSGGSAGIPSPPGPPNFMSIPRIYLPPQNYSLFVPPFGVASSPIPNQGAEITPVDLNFGTFGVLGVGRRDGLTGDAQGSYQVVSGVNTYVPDSHMTATQDGYADGDLQGLSFDQTGTIVGSFTNGQRVDLAQVAMAEVMNPEGLNNVGNNYFTASPSSGALQLGVGGQNGLGTIEGYSLEGSNVDLTVELTNMVIAQRGFQTNARVISAVDNTLQVLTQLGQ